MRTIFTKSALFLSFAVGCAPNAEDPGQSSAAIRGVIVDGGSGGTTSPTGGSTGGGSSGPRITITSPGRPAAPSSSGPAQTTSSTPVVLSERVGLNSCYYCDSANPNCKAGSRSMESFAVNCDGSCGYQCGRGTMYRICSTSVFGSEPVSEGKPYPLRDATFFFCSGSKCNATNFECPPPPPPPTGAVDGGTSTMPPPPPRDGGTTTPPPDGGPSTPPPPRDGGKPTTPTADGGVSTMPPSSDAGRTPPPPPPDGGTNTPPPSHDGGSTIPPPPAGDGGMSMVPQLPPKTSCFVCGEMSCPAGSDTLLASEKSCLGRCGYRCDATSTARQRVCSADYFGPETVPTGVVLRSGGAAFVFCSGPNCNGGTISCAAP